MLTRIYASIFAVLFLCGCNLSYGPQRDYSEFVSTRLMDDEKTVLFSYHQFVYRPAEGLRAFPDGGIPKYIKDSNLLATYDMAADKTRVLLKKKNREWQPGSGNFFINAVKGPKALISQGGQLAGKYTSGLKHHLVDVQSGKVESLDLKSDLAGYGRDTGEIHLVDELGTLVFVTVSVAQAANPSANRNDEIVPEIWVRTPSGKYMKVAANSHYEFTRNGEVIYWDPATRLFMAFSISTGATRVAPEYKTPPYQDVFKGVILSSGKKGVEYGVKANDKWTYVPVGPNAEAVKDLF